MGDDYKQQLKNYWSNFKSVFPRKSLEDGKKRTRSWAIQLKKELKLKGELDKNWESFVDIWLEELEKEWPTW